MEEISYLLASAAIRGFVITAASGKFMIPALHRLHFGQTIREEGPLVKGGCPRERTGGLLRPCGSVHACRAAAGIPPPRLRSAPPFNKGGFCFL